MPASRKERDSIENDTPLASMYQMRESLHGGLPSPPLDHAPAMPSRWRPPPTDDILGRLIEVTTRLKSGRPKRRGSLTFANSINDLPRSGSSRRIMSESELGNSWSTLENSKSSLQQLGDFLEPPLNFKFSRSPTFTTCLKKRSTTCG
jgi:hypothetical protein